MSTFLHSRPATCEHRRVDDADLIWNRAATERGGYQPGPGDSALAALLSLHGLAMSGGLLDAVERLPREQLDRAEAAYRWFGLESAANVLATVGGEVEEGALDDDDLADALEARAEEEYGRAVPSDRVLVDAFRARLTEEPSAFAPLH